MSYRGDNDPIEAQDSPQTAFNSLFSGFMPDDSAELARFDFLQRSRASVLDLILAKRDRILGMVGNADTMRLERHFDEIRDLERRISQMPATASGQCQVPSDPGTDPAVGGDNADSGSGGIARSPMGQLATRRSIPRVVFSRPSTRPHLDSRRN